jgi:Bacterial SH3 domain
VETLVQEEVKSSVATTEDTIARINDRNSEIDELLKIKQSRKINAGRIPCPCCTVVVEISTNRCPFCDSDIAAEAALARETTRRLKELSGELDTEHGARTQDKKPERRGFFARLKYLFEGDPEPEPEPTVTIDPHAKRLLGLLSPGDSLKVLEEDGPWLKVKTLAGDIGWVYSTVRKTP